MYRHLCASSTNPACKKPARYCATEGVNRLDLWGARKHVCVRMRYKNTGNILLISILAAMFAACASEKMDRSQLTALEETPPEQSAVKEETQADPAKDDFSKKDDTSKQADEPLEEADDGIMGLTYKGDTEISYCFSNYITDAETRSIAEIFTGEEYTQGYLTMRTQPDKRAGRYFSFMVSGPDEIPFGTTITLEVDSSKRLGVSKYVFTVPETHSLLREVKLGITGSDWPDPEERVNAWKISIKNPYGLPVVEKESWLWSIKGKEITREELQEDLKRRRHIAEKDAIEAVEQAQADEKSAAEKKDGQTQEVESKPDKSSTSSESSDKKAAN